MRQRGKTDAVAVELRAASGKSFSPISKPRPLAVGCR